MLKFNLIFNNNQFTVNLNLTQPVTLKLKVNTVFKSKYLKVF